MTNLNLGETTAAVVTSVAMAWDLMAVGQVVALGQMAEVVLAPGIDSCMLVVLAPLDANLGLIQLEVLLL